MNECFTNIKQKIQEIAQDLEETRKQLNEQITQKDQIYNALKTCFDYQAYRELNSDLINLSCEELLNHFISNGLKEGRHLTESIVKNHEKSKYTYREIRAVQELSRRYVGEQLSINTSNQLSEKNKDKCSRIISKTIGTRLPLDKNKDFKFAMQHTLYAPYTKTLASFIPKNGCTSLRYSFAIANNIISGPEDLDWIHSNNQSMNASLENIQNFEYSFVILRNPYERLASAFWNKFIPSSQVDFIDQSGKIFINLLNKGKINSFKDFVNTLWEDPMLISKDGHLRYQTDFLLLSNYDNYFSISDFKLLQKTLLDQVELKIIDTRDFTNHTTFGCKKKSDCYYGSHSIEELTKIKSQKMSINYINFYDEEDAYKITNLYYNDIVVYIEKTGDLESAKYYLRKGLVHSTYYQI